MTSLELARWQFGITTLYHFIFVPVTIGLATFTRLLPDPLVPHRGRALAACDALLGQAAADLVRPRRGDGDRPGVPVRDELVELLALRGRHLRRPAGDGGPGRLLRGVDLPRAVDLRLGQAVQGVHLACAWAVAGSTALSAYFILAANSWMQHPVGYDMHAGRARLTNIFDVLFNNTAVYAFVHTMLAALLTAGMLVIAVSAWHIRRGSEGAGVFGGSIRLALPMVAVAAFLQFFVGHFDGRADVQAAADEDVGRRRGLRDQGRCGAVALRDGRLQVQSRGPEPQRADPQPAVVDLDRLPARGDQGRQRHQPRVPARSTGPASTRPSSPSSTGPGGR